jgi:hypothetical protein
MWRATPRLQVGIELNPLVDDVGPLANWLAVEETSERPAILLGTSSDRIGTAKGQVYYATASKNLQSWLGVPISPYLGVSWSDGTNQWEELGGVNYRLLDGRLSVTHLWDGVNLHHTLDAPGVLDVGFARASLGVILAEQKGKYFAGLTVGVAF